MFTVKTTLALLDACNQMVKDRNYYEIVRQGAK
jgi:hypothetical protein